MKTLPSVWDMYEERWCIAENFSSFFYCTIRTFLCDVLHSYSLKFNVIYHILYPLLLHIFSYNIIFLCKQYKIGIFFSVLLVHVTLWILNIHIICLTNLVPICACEICQHHIQRFFSQVDLIPILKSING